MNKLQIIKKLTIVVLTLVTILLLTSCIQNADNNSLQCYMTLPQVRTDVPLDTDIELTFSTNIDQSFGSVSVDDIEIDADECWLDLNETVLTIDQTFFEEKAIAGQEITVTVSGFTAYDDPNIMMEDPKTFTFTYEE